jgi:CheY-like chemotaxis protein
LNALFQPFNRLGQEAGVQEGTGIGLVLTKRLVELMGGSLGVTSTPGIGTVFWIELPSVAGAAAVAPEVLTAPDPAPRTSLDADAPMTVLCVEDNPVSLKLIREFIGPRKDLRMLTASNGRAGLEMARDHLPDVILLDNNMPVMTGREAQRFLAADPITASIPVIAISANAMHEAVSESMAAGYFRYLTKPVDFEKLTEALDSALVVARTRRRKRT